MEAIPGTHNTPCPGLSKGRSEYNLEEKIITKTLTSRESSNECCKVRERI